MCRKIIKTDSFAFFCLFAGLVDDVTAQSDDAHIQRVKKRARVPLIR